MPELKKTEDLIIDDEETRTLLKMLLGTWGSPEAQQIDDQIKTSRSRVIDGTAQLRYGYPSEIYDQVAHSGDFAKSYTRADEAEALFKSLLGLKIKKCLLLIINTLGDICSKEQIDLLENELKKAKEQYLRKNNRMFNEIAQSLAVQLTGKPINVVKPLGRRQTFTKQEVKQRSLAIISAINAKKGEMGIVAVTFYGVFDVSNPSKGAEIRKAYRVLNLEGKQKYRSKFANLLKEKNLSYEDLIREAKDNS